MDVTRANLYLNGIAFQVSEKSLVKQHLNYLLKGVELSPPVLASLYRKQTNVLSYLVSVKEMQNHDVLN